MVRDRRRCRSSHRHWRLAGVGLQRRKAPGTRCPSGAPAGGARYSAPDASAAHGDRRESTVATGNGFAAAPSTAGQSVSACSGISPRRSRCHGRPIGAASVATGCGTYTSLCAARPAAANLGSPRSEGCARCSAGTTEARDAYHRA